LDCTVLIPVSLRSISQKLFQCQILGLWFSAWKRRTCSLVVHEATQATGGSTRNTKEPRFFKRKLVKRKLGVRPAYCSSSTTTLPLMIPVLVTIFTSHRKCRLLSLNCQRGFSKLPLFLRARCAGRTANESIRIPRSAMCIPQSRDGKSDPTALLEGNPKHESAAGDTVRTDFLRSTHV